MDQRFGLKGFVHITAAVVVIIIIIRIQAAAAAAAECYEHIVDAAATHRSTLPQRAARHPQPQPHHLGELVSVTMHRVAAVLIANGRIAAATDRIALKISAARRLYYTQ